MRVRRMLVDALATVTRPFVADTAHPVRDGARWLSSAGPISVSTHDLGHEVATAVSEALEAGGLAPFLVERSGDGFVLGVLAEHRRSAATALARALDGPGWHVRWADGRRNGTVALPRAARDRHVRRARRWQVFRAHSWGDELIGANQGADITFWEPGTSGELELVGERGHHRFDASSPATIEVIDGRRYPGRTAFPIERDLEAVDLPIDIVYTWVDGGDAAWQERLRTTERAHGKSVDPASVDPARFATRDELRYSLRSVWAFCGWARSIVIVTDGQVPTWLRTDDRIRVVPHSAIMPSDALPTFNSHAIEASLHRIEGLAEHFIYFNDDVFVGRPVRPELFFTPNGLAKFFPSGARVPGVETVGRAGADAAALRERGLLRDRFGRFATTKLLHAPHPLRRSTIENLSNEFADVIDATVRARFRSPSDVSVAASFAAHYGALTGRAVPGSLDAAYVHLESGRRSVALDRIGLGRDYDTFCLNETSAVPGDPTERDRQLVDFLERYFPIAAPWERDGAR